jgi:hypothetical protein
MKVGEDCSGKLENLEVQEGLLNHGRDSILLE